MNSNISLVIEREYRERVAKKSFIITTILMPLFMLAMMVAPALIMALGGSSSNAVLVVDNTHSAVIASQLKSNGDVRFIPSACTIDSALRRTDVDGVLVVPRDVVDSKTATLKYYSNGPSALSTETNITRQVNDIIEDMRLKEYNIANLDKILGGVKSDVAIQTIRNDREDQEETSSELSFGLGIMLTFVLYMFLLLYGQMVMTSIIEEKNNRVLELVVSTVKPWQIMIGKITGVALVALTQIVIWAVLIALMVVFIIPAVLPADAMQEVAAMQAGTFDAGASQYEASLVRAMATLSDVGYILNLLGVMTLFLIGGFMLYASIFAAIGSAVDNIQDASQLQTVIVMPIIIGLICAMTAAQDPNTQLAFWLSMIPFTSPMVMMARVPFGIPAWEVVLSLVLLFIGFVFMIWVAAKIYRVGIFMYGKKPNIKDLIRWINYK